MKVFYTTKVEVHGIIENEVFWEIRPPLLMMITPKMLKKQFLVIIVCWHQRDSGVAKDSGLNSFWLMFWV